MNFIAMDETNKQLKVQLYQNLINRPTYDSVFLIILKVHGGYVSCILKHEVALYVAYKKNVRYVGKVVQIIW